MTMMATIGCCRGSKTNSEELFHAPFSIRRRFRCSRANSGRIKSRHRSRLPLLPKRSRLGLAGPLPFLDLPTMLGDRIWHPIVLWAQPALRLCAAAARRLAALLTNEATARPIASMRWRPNRDVWGSGALFTRNLPRLHRSGRWCAVANKNLKESSNRHFGRRRQSGCTGHASAILANTRCTSVGSR
jgi:hypothetical protein